MSDPFVFKQFSILQDKCAMKVGTDGVLLGAWASVDHNPETVLDIGSGTGVIALQLAQRSEAHTIDAIEMDDNAHAQCVENFESSSWADRLFCYHASIQEFASEVDERYDLIVSNPPFYTEDYKTNDPSRDRARFADSLPFDHLAICASHLLSERGRFAIILPFKAAEAFSELANEQGLHLYRSCTIKGSPETAIKRALLEFSFHEVGQIKEESLVIETARHQYTEAYKALVKDFYLKL